MVANAFNHRFERQGISELENSQDYTESLSPDASPKIPHLQEKKEKKAGSHQKELAGINLTDFCLLGARIKDVCQYAQQFYRKSLICVSLKPEDYMLWIYISE